MFSCDALASPDHTVSWTFTDFNQTVMDIVSNIKYTIVGDRNDSRFGELTVVNVTYEDRGVYTCSAANSIGTVTASANLTVHGKTEVEKKIGDIYYNYIASQRQICMFVYINSL